MDPEISVVGRAVKTQIHPKRYRGPCRILLAAVKADLPGLERGSASQGGGLGVAYLVGLFRFQFLKDLLRLRFGGTHGDEHRS
jgi:hypothetical protein